MQGFADGLLHPVTLPLHMLALVGLSLLIGRQARGARWSAVAAFAAGLGGGLLGIAGGAGDTGASNVVLSCAFVCGILATLDYRWHFSVTALLAAVTGAGIGLASPPDVVSLARANAMLIGVFCAATIIVAGMSAAVAHLARPWQIIGVRVAGSWIAASAALVLAVRIARL